MFQPFYITQVTQLIGKHQPGTQKRKTAALGSFVFILSTLTSKVAVLTVVDFEMVPYPKVFQSQVTVMFSKE